MPPPLTEQNVLYIGVDVGGTFTDLACFDAQIGELRVVKLPSTPPNFDLAVLEAIGQVLAPGHPAHIVHGSTVATNALLERSGRPCAFVTTEGFGDLLLIGRQNRPHLYSLRVERPRPLTDEANWFTVRERIGPDGKVIEPLSEPEVDRLLERIRTRGLEHVAVCLLFSFINPAHEQMIAARFAEAGLTVSLSSQVLPEFREYERATTTVINASLRPIIKSYLEALEHGLADSVLSSSLAMESPPPDLRIMHCSGGTLSVREAQESAAKLVLSGPAGGVLGAAFVAEAAGFRDIITYDMGGTSTDVAIVVDGRPQRTTSGMLDGLPMALPAFDIHTIGAGGGSVAYLDPGGALRVGPRSTGAVPGPACYGRGGTEPTVTDANLLLGRILPDQFMGGAMRIDRELARRALEPLARSMGKSVEQTALGIVRVAEHNMGQAVRAVTSRRGLDPRCLTLVSFGGAGGLHACALAEALEIPRVLVPPHCGVLSALGMVVAPPVAEASRTVVHLGEQLDDARLAAEFGMISGQTMDAVPYDQTACVEAHADVRFRGQSHELTVRIERPTRAHVSEQFLRAYRDQYGPTPGERPVEIVTLRVRRIGRAPALRLPKVTGSESAPVSVRLIVPNGEEQAATALTRSAIFAGGRMRGPLLLIDPGATAYVPTGWTAAANEDGCILLDCDDA